MMEEVELPLQCEDSNAEPVALRAPWLLFLFLSLAFAWATPYELDYSVQNHGLDEMVQYATEGYLGRRVAMPLLGISGLFLLLDRRNRRLRINGWLGLAFGSFLVLAFASFFWAEDLAIAARRLTVFGLLLVNAVGLAARFTLREIIIYICLICYTVILLGLGCELAWGTFLQPPDYGIYQFSGVMHPNGTASYCAVGSLASVVMAGLEPRRRKFYLGLAAVGLGFLMLTKSRTAFGSAIIALFLYWVFTTDLKRKVVTLLCVGVICCVVGIIYSDDFSTRLTDTILMGRAEEGTIGSLSNRLPLWQECLSYVAKRPLLGYGYDSFWTPQHVYTISTHQGWDVPHSHNGYLEMLLSLGVIGFFVYLLVLALYFKTTFASWMNSGNQACLFGFLIIVWLCLEMLTEKVYMFPVFPSYVCNLLIARFAFIHGEEQDESLNSCQSDGPEQI